MVALFFCSSCTTSRKLTKYINPSHEFFLAGNADSDKTIRIYYVTCGMLILQHGNDAVLFDPFFSYQKPIALVTSIKTRERFYERFRDQMEQEKPVDRAAVQAGFISHTHYDHLMDLPVLINDHYFPNMKNIYGNSFMPDIMYHWRDKGVKLNSIGEDQLYNPLAENDPDYTWIKAADSIEVLPIASLHAPHKMGILVMNSDLNRKYFTKEKFRDPYTRSGAFKLDGGCSYSFLVRFKKKDGSYFKIFIQTSASAPPYGLPPPGETADIAILCYASMQEVNDYPRYFVSAIKPDKLVLIHWENFFRYPKNRDDVKFVPGTNKKVVRKRLSEVESLPSPPEIVIPKPGTLIKVGY